MTDVKYDRVAELALQALNAIEKPAKASSIKEWVRQNYTSEWPQLEASWAPYMSRAVTSEESPIVRVGDSYKYDLLKEPRTTVPPPPPEPPADVANYVARESRLYPLLVEWLASMGYQASDTSKKKSGGSWGNPDVAGIRIEEGFLAQKSVEVATVEAKLAAGNWRQDFFQAVSRKRFAHRAYFAFAEGSDEPSLQKLPDMASMREYAEKFRVGVLVVFLPKATFTQLTQGNATDVTLSLDEVRVDELWPAVRDTVAPGALDGFLRTVMSISHDADLYHFGREL